MIDRQTPARALINAADVLDRAAEILIEAREPECAIDIYSESDSLRERAYGIRNGNIQPEDTSYEDYLISKGDL